MIEYFEFRAMNTDIVLAADGTANDLAPGFTRVEKFMCALEKQLTRFSDTSELAQLNRSSGNWFHASEELFAIVRQARALYDETDGLFDPTILDALELSGYAVSMDEIRAHGVHVVYDSANPVWHNFRDVHFDDQTRAIFLPPGMRIDLGGIAKGWIAERAAHQLAEFTNAGAVDAGGDMFVIGQPPGQDAWQIALEDPRDAANTLAILNVAAGAIATSSIARRRWQIGNQIKHHLIDPRTGTSAETDWLSVTVIAPETAVAEVYAKALLIAGSRDAPTIAQRRDDLSFIAVDRDGKISSSFHAEELLHD